LDNRPDHTNCHTASNTASSLGVELPALTPSAMAAKKNPPPRLTISNTRSANVSASAVADADADAGVGVCASVDETLLATAESPDGRC